MFGNELGRTAVHEAGHWLGLKHLWGDTDCGDDLVHDTPQQRSFTPGCPTGVRTSCGTNVAGDMYMNYMDFTSDACVNMFTIGQKQRMRSLFNTGGLRNSLLYSKALGNPSSEELLLPETAPRWLHIKLYPNPAVSELTLNLEHDARWIGELLIITNAMGVTVQQVKISSTRQNIGVGHLRPGIYFIRSDRKDGEKLRERFAKI
jgi:hypothetical protein